MGAAGMTLTEISLSIETLAGARGVTGLGSMAASL